MRITSGLFDHMVLQRNGRGVSDTPVLGETTEGEGDLFLRASRKFQTWKKVARVRRGKFTFTLKGLPAGGPYEIELELRHGRKTVERLKVRDVLVGDVWIVAGQSNMEGCGFLSAAAKPHAAVRAFYMGDRWGVAKDPIHDLWNCVDAVHVEYRGVRPGVKKFVGTGPAVEFGKEMRRRTGVPQGLIACSHGGTSMAVWGPRRKKLGGRSFYGATLRRVRKNGGKVAGAIWYQGESDATEESHAHYTKAMKELVGSLRRDLGNARLPFAMVQLARTINSGNFLPEHWQSIQEQQRRLPRVIPRLAVVPAIDSEIDDIIHIGGESNHRVGRRLAGAMHYLAAGRKAALPPIELRDITVKRDKRHSHTDITVRYDHVKGGLRADGRASGFAIADHGELPLIFATHPSGNSVTLRTPAPPEFLDGLSLYYGHGNNPYCNIHDGEDRSLPVFGPYTFGHKHAVTPYARRMAVTKVLPGAGDLGKLRYPKNIQGWGLREFTGPYCRMEQELMEAPEEDRMLFYRCRVHVPERMKLRMLLGHDGRVKAWIDGKEKFHDPKGAPPMHLDEGKILWNATPGTHEILIAFGTQLRGVWGICFRLERLGVSLKRVQKNPSGTMPRFVD